ncbi:venom protease-like isoform X2 [Pieris rapae]|uniref:venom protease-like isoform X2 n=1 Tax=Pieris rapae TaxID=64459 RepID=UPI001E27C92D|nr:venom protease-like isoform X2 [Pieris rapae]
MINKLIFSLLVLHISAVLGNGICKDCMEYTKCKAAFDHATLKQDNVTKQLFFKAYCGVVTKNGQMIYKVCCSIFPPFEMPSLDSRSGISKDHLLPEMCGSILGNRIVGGKYAKLYEFPWMAIIFYNTRFGHKRECSGSIINSKYILTAAHCVVNKDIAGVRIGEYDVSRDDDCDYQPGVSPVCEKHIQEMYVELAIPHSEFRRGPPENDIALLRVEGEINFSYPNVEPICLPITPELQNKVLDYMTGTVAGWGVTETRKEATRLMKVDIPVKSNSDCKMYYLNSPNQHHYFKRAMKNQFCAGELGKDSCDGDSGGPFMIKDIYKDVNRYVQYGVVSSGPGLCGSGEPGFYTDVSKFVNWILDNIKE